MGNERKHKLKKKSAKFILKIFIRRILGIPHLLTALYVKLSLKILRFFRKKLKNKTDDDIKDL